MRTCLAAAVLTIVLAGITACTSGAGPAQPGHGQAAPTSAPATSAASATSVGPSRGQSLGAPGCHPASPLIIGTLGRQVEGTGRGASLWGLLMFAHPQARVGDQEKIVWRMTGSGSLTLEAIGPGGERHRLAWGPEAHGGSNWDEPGDEWGAGYVFTAPGCWDLRAIRGRASADVWLRVASR